MTRIVVVAYIAVSLAGCSGFSCSSSSEKNRMGLRVEAEFDVATMLQLIAGEQQAYVRKMARDVDRDGVGELYPLESLVREKPALDNVSSVVIGPTALPKPGHRETSYRIRMFVLAPNQSTVEYYYDGPDVMVAEGPYCVVGWPFNPKNNLHVFYLTQDGHVYMSDRHADKVLNGDADPAAALASVVLKHRPEGWYDLGSSHDKLREDILRLHVGDLR